MPRRLAVFAGLANRLFRILASSTYVLSSGPVLAVAFFRKDVKVANARVAQGEVRMSPAQLRLWAAIRIEPEKWQQHPYGDLGKGFWVVALIGRNVIWYNDIEEGFNRSVYVTYGQIEDYWCNQDELELTIEYLMNSLERGTDLVHMRNKPVRVPR